MRGPLRLAITAVVLPAAILGLTACTQPGPLPSLGLAASPSPSPSVTPGLSVQAIADLALRAAAGSGTVVSVHDGSAGTVWDARVVRVDGTVQEVHLSTAGRVLAGPSAVPTSADDRSANRAIVAASVVSLNGAADRMTAAVPQGRVTAIVLEHLQDRVVWRGDVTNARGVRQDVRVDAVNGSVLLNLTDGQRSSGGS